MKAFVAIAGADLGERMRRFSFLLIVAMAVYAGYLYVPGAHASYSTVVVNDHRGIYNSAYVSAAITVLTTSFLSLFGFFFVRGSVERDWELHTDQLVAASPARRVRFLLGKWGSNLALLALVSAITYAASIGMQEWHGEDRAFDVLAYVLPYLFITLPALGFVSALAIVFDVVAPLRGVFGGALYVVVVWMALLIIPFSQSADLTRHASFDPLGGTDVVMALERSERTAFPFEKSKLDVSIGGSPAPKGGFTTYRFGGIAWTAPLIGIRVLWLLVSAAIVVAIAPLFDLFRRERSTNTKRDRKVDLARIVPELPLLTRVRAEFLLLVNGASLWWFAGAVVLAVLGAALPMKPVTDFVLPIALLWPLEQIAMLGMRERQFHVFDILASTRGFNWRTTCAQWAAGACLSALLSAGLLMRLAAGGQFISALALLAMLATLVAVALAFGSWTGTARAFQACFLIFWYIGPIEHLPQLDIALQAQTHPLASLVVALVVSVAALASVVFSRVSGEALR